MRLILALTPMELYIAGINHFDPLCRVRLGEWLKYQSSCHSMTPAFIAVEADAEVYRQLLVQREIFRKMLEKEFPNLQRDVKEMLALTIYYEADTHSTVFHASTIIWLDAERMFSRAAITDYAKDRLAIYRRFLNKGMALDKISEQLWNFDWNEQPTTPLGDPDHTRDDVFYKKIKDTCDLKNDSWAIAIVGATHAADREHSMRQLLESSGIKCHTAILNRQDR
ncbi:MAG: hypothetical protein M0R70_05665 [Nitrospirae bacterium]|nr:hypothetical protein [Nitrospirota bacterium]